MQPLSALLISLRLSFACKAMDDWTRVFAPDEMLSYQDDIPGHPLSPPVFLPEPTSTSTSAGPATMKASSGPPVLDNPVDQSNRHHRFHQDSMSKYRLAPTASAELPSTPQSTALRTEPNHENFLGSSWLESFLHHSAGNSNHHNHEVARQSSLQDVHQAQRIQSQSWISSQLFLDLK
ncbi:hypothetical protein PGTUg99_034359 [Puccinia graminis f. sp. tritici]|nr:hypothetical protein PGTUg99_034359 [Puccinia graminis f. sp. tritici]